MAHRPKQRSSDRAFGLFFAAIALVLGLEPLRHGAAARIPALAVALVLVFAAVLAPRALGPFNRAWTAIGRGLERITGPLVLALIDDLAVTPFAWVARALGKPTLPLDKHPGDATYWVARTAPLPDPDRLRRPF